MISPRKRVETWLKKEKEPIQKIKDTNFKKERAYEAKAQRLEIRTQYSISSTDSGCSISKPSETMYRCIVLRI